MLYVLRAAINVSVALNRRGMRHKSSIQSSGGWRQPTLFLPRAGILYGRCTCHRRPLNRLNGDRRSTIDRLFLFLRPSRRRDARGTENRGECEREREREETVAGICVRCIAQRTRHSPARGVLAFRESWRIQKNIHLALYRT